MPNVKGYQVVVNFGDRVSGDIQGAALMHMEQYMRERWGLPFQVFKETMADDSKLRSKMTPEERAKL